jgi:D-ribose pyranose/furanose isomerase RbsD
MDYRDTMTDDALLAAYRRTRFCADTTQGRIVIRVGESRPELNAILGATGCETWAYVTAFNPGSVRLSDAE